MRDYSVGEVEYFEFTLGARKVYRLPLLKYMPISVIRKIARANAIVDEEERQLELLDMEMDVLRSYIGDVVDKLTGDQVGAIFSDWHEANEQAGAESGE